MNKINLKYECPNDSYEFRGLFIIPDRVSKPLYYIFDRIVNCHMDDLDFYGYDHYQNNHYKIWVKYRYETIKSSINSLMIDGGSLRVDGIKNNKTRIDDYSVKKINFNDLNDQNKATIKVLKMSFDEYLSDPRSESMEKLFKCKGLKK